MFSLIYNILFNTTFVIVRFVMFQLFSKYVGLSAEFLPEEAKLIHQESKGSPMVISLIGSFISESGRHSQRHRQSGRWAYYLNNLKQRRYSEKMICFFNQTLSKPILDYESYTIWKSYFIFSTTFSIYSMKNSNKKLCLGFNTFWILLNQFHEKHEFKLKKCFSGKFKKQHSYQYESLMEAVLISIENLPENLKSRYKELAVFHDDVGIPQSVYSFSFRLLGNLYISWYFF